MKNPGITKAEFGTMSTRELDRPLDAGALREVERALRGRLSAYGLSAAFIDRTAEDAAQKAWEEYWRLQGRGELIENPRGFVVYRAFRRAVDELRREKRRADGAVLDVLIETGSASAPEQPATEEDALAHVEAEEVREAVRRLSPEEQQVLSLYYFDGLSAEDSAAALYCAESTYRYRLKIALKKLGRLLGAPVPEPGSELAIEIGVIAWVALRGANVALSGGPLDRLVAVPEAVHDRLAWVVDRVRDLVGRTASSGGSERLLALAGGGPGKAVGTCVVGVACLLAAGVPLPGAGGGRPDDHATRRPATSQRRAAKPASSAQRIVTAPPVPAPGTSATPTRASGAHAGGQGSKTQASEQERAANAAIRSQSPESVVSSEEPAAEPPPETAPTPSSSGPTPNKVAASQSLESLAP
jgi:RNA polymerase sigma-70 factor (ECF subfamily)